jgi:hypothetical protein
MLELLMHEAQMLKQQGKKIGQIAEALGCFKGKSQRIGCLPPLELTVT